MFSFRLWRKGRGEDPPKSPRIPPPAPQEFSTSTRHRRPGKGWIDPGIAGEEPGWAPAGGKEPGSRGNAGARREELGDVPVGARALGKDFGDEPGRAGNGNGNGNGKVPRAARDPPRPPLRGERGESSGASRSRDRDTGAAPAPGRSPELPPRERLREKLRQLGEAVGEREGESTAALAARLTRLIVGTPTPSYPSDPGPRSAGSQPGTSPERREPAGILVGMLRVEGRREDPGWDQELARALPFCQEELPQDWNSQEELPHDWNSQEWIPQDWNSQEWIPQEQFFQDQLPQDWNSQEELPQDWNSQEWIPQDWNSQEELPQDWNSQEWIPQDQFFQDQLPQDQLPQDELSRALEEEFGDVWARSRLDCGLLPEEERLDGPPVLFQPRQRPRSPAEERLMAELLQEYLEEGIVVESTSECESPLRLVPKPKGRGWRLTLDCRALNAATPAGPPERPRRERILASVHPRSRFFSVLDLSNACLAVPLARSSQPRFAFTFRGRRFQFARLPPTFRGSGSVLQRRVAAVLARLERGAAAGVFHYHDDILVTGKTRRQAEHRTRLVLELIRGSGFKANRDKAQLLRRQVSYLGVTLGAEGHRVPQEKLREIRRDCDAAGPWSPGRLLSVLGKFGSWQGYIPDYRELALPLQRLAAPGKRGRVWEWGPEQRQQLRRLLEALEAAPALRFPDKSRPFLLRLSVHAETAGAVLLQENRGILLPVGHCSHRLGGRDLAPPDAWLVAAARAVQAFEIFTGPAPVVIQDPSGNFLLRGEEFVTGGGSGESWLPQEWPRVAEPWTLLVAPPEPQESQRIQILPAPPLRQLPAGIPRANVWFLAVEQGLFPVASVGFGAVSLEGRRMDGVCGKGSEADAELEALREILEQHQSRFPLFLYCGHRGLAARLERREREQGWNSGGNAWRCVLRWLRAFPGMLHVREVGTGAEPLEKEQLEKVSSSARVLGCITRSSWILWTPSRHERQEIIARCHGRHEGLEPTLARVEAVESWKDSRRDVERWVRSCPTCRESDPDPDPGPQRAEGPWSCLRISLSEALPGTPEGFQALLVVQDALSGWLDAFPLRRRSRPDVSRALLREVFGRFGSVRSVLLAPAPAWLWDSLHRAPLENFWSRLERSGPQAAAAGVFGAARALGAGWAAMLPLILAGARSRWIQEDRLSALLCVPGLPLEWCREWREDPGGSGELSRLRGARLRPGHRPRVEAALRAPLRTGPGPGISEVRDWGTPDPGSQYARAEVTVSWIRDWALPGQELGGAGSGIVTCRTQAPP